MTDPGEPRAITVTDTHREFRGLVRRMREAQKACRSIHPRKVSHLEKSKALEREVDDWLKLGPPWSRETQEELPL